MEEVLKFLSENSTVYFATSDEKGNPKVRPFQFLFSKERKFYFCTSNEKEVFKQLQHNPNVEICTLSPNYTWLRLCGKAVFSNDFEIKKQILDENPSIKSIYNSPDNPSFESFYLENVKATFYDFSGNPPKEYNL